MTNVEDLMAETRATVPISYQEAAAVKFAVEALEAVLLNTNPTPEHRRIVGHNIARLSELHEKILDTPE